MKVVFHLGFHCTESAFLLRCLRRNRDALREPSVLVPAPDRYRSLIRTALEEFEQEAPPRSVQEDLLGRIVGEQSFETLILSWEDFICVPQHVARGRRLYPMVARKAQALAGLFPVEAVDFAVALRNPGTLLPALHGKLRPQKPFEDFIDAINLTELKWSETLAELHGALPASNVVAWCHEDSALLWGRILHAVSGVEVPAGEAFAARLMTSEGENALRSRLADRQGLGAADQSALAVEVLERHPKTEALSAEYDLPGWTPERVWRLTEHYEEDVARLEQAQGLHFLRA